MHKVYQELQRMPLVSQSDYVMSIVLDQAAITLGRETLPCALVTVKSIGGLNREVNQTLASEVTSLLEEKSGIKADYLYCVFEDIPAVNWAWQGQTFG